MHIKSNLLVLSAAVMAVGCASTSKPVSDVAVINQVATQASNQLGFSLGFTGKDGWSVTEETPYKIVFSKQNPDKSERYVIQALVVKLPNFDNDQEFLNYVEKSIDKNRQKTNLRVLEQHVSFASGQGEKCVRYNSKEAPMYKSKKSKQLVLGMVNYTCRHPDKANTGVYMAYSKKSYADKVDENLMSQAESIFSSLSFNKF